MNRRLRIAVLVAALAIGSVVQALPVYRPLTQVLSLTAVDATGSASVGVLASGYRFGIISIRVTAAAGWSGTVTLTPTVVGTDTGGTPTTVNLAALSIDGAGIGTYDYAVDGALTVEVDVTGNDKGLNVHAVLHTHTE